MIIGDIIENLDRKLIPLGRVYLFDEWSDYEDEACPLWEYHECRRKSIPFPEERYIELLHGLTKAANEAKGVPETACKLRDLEESVRTIYAIYGLLQRIVGDANTAVRLGVFSGDISALIQTVVKESNDG